MVSQKLRVGTGRQYPIILLLASTYLLKRSDRGFGEGNLLSRCLMKYKHAVGYFLFLVYHFNT